MFRLHKHRAAKSGDKIEFRISHLKALQVPKGWDKLFVSVVSIENGKTIAKSSKVPVRNGSCQWSDTFSESVSISRDNSSKEIDDCLLKLIVAMGSSRSGILGEATVSLTSYMSSGAAIPLSIRLNKCNHGTVLHVTVQCLTPRTKLRDQESSETNFHLKAINENNYDVAVKSNESDCSNVQSVKSSSVEDFDSILSPGETETRATSFSESVSNCSHNSTEGSTGRGNISPCISDRQSPTGRQDSTSSQKSVSHHDYPGNDSSQSNNSSFNSQNMQDIGALSSKTTNASNNRLEAAEDTSEELRAEAKMWEMNARKLMGDLDMLRTEFSDQSKKLAGMEMDLSAALVERDSLKKEVEQLKLSFEDPIVRQRALEDSVSQGECIPEIENALKEELKFEKESNANLSLQLKRSQEANVELVSVLQELEETIEQQKIEIQKLSSLPSKFSDLEKSFQLSIEGNKRLRQELEQLEESKKNLLVKVQELEGALEDKMRDTEHAKIQNNKTLSDIAMEYESKLSAKDIEILSSKAKLFDSIPESCNVETVSRNLVDADLLREIEALKEKVQELEMDCNELTEENLELLFKLKEAKKNSKDSGASEDLLSDKLKDQSSTSFGSEVSNNLFRIFHSEDMLQGKNDIKIRNDGHISIQELETSKLALEVRITDLNKELTNKIAVIGNLEANLSYKEKEIGVLQKLLGELEAKVYHLEQEKSQLEKHMEAMIKENKHELELHISDVEQEKQQLSIRVSVLEAQLRNLTNEQEFRLSELENSRSQAARLQEKIMEMQSEIDSSTEDFKQKLKVAQIRWSEAQEEFECLSGANQKLQITVENLAEECSSLEKLNGDLRQQNLKLEEHCSLMGARLRESDERFAKCSERVELLEKKFALMLEDIASKEKHLTSDLDWFLDENRKLMEQGQVLLNQMQMEKMVEAQNLELEVENLSLKLSAANDEKERIASNALLEVSALRADKAKLESAFEETQSKVVLAKNEVDMMQTQYEQKLKNLTTQLAEYKIKMEMLMTEHEKLLKLVEDHKSREIKFKSTINALELKLTVTEYERQQIMDESGNLKVQLQQTYQFENEIIALKNELNASNSEKEKLEASLRLTSELCEDLKAEKTSSGLKILALEKAASELEDCKRTRASLEERLVQLENDLKAREVRCVQDTELSHSKRINRQHQQTIQLLEQEKAEFQTKAQALEEELKLIKEQKRNQVSKLNRKCLPVHDDLKASKNPGVKNTNQHRSNRRKSLKNDREIMKDQQDPCYSIKHQSEVETELGLLDENVHAVEVDPLSKTQLLETELAKAKEANNIYEVQLDRTPSQGRNNQANGPVKSLAEELVTKETFERTKSMLEAELRDIQERYFHMSLKYAEVEAEREELVMKLKVAKNKKGWLS
ncbi:sporulation-specific protein 15 [Spatholobus suberectus]|nr:sporulation-specific protein 15 [Spatholobus suberectus]